MAVPYVTLKPKRAQPFFARHPWVFAGAVESVNGNPGDGDEVIVRSATDKFVARGFFNNRSKIRVRLYTWKEDEDLDEQFFRGRFESALRLRQLALPNVSTYRLIASEGDGLSGLTVDRYDRWLTVQMTSLAMANRSEMIGRLLLQLSGCEGIYVRTEKDVGRLEGLELHDHHLAGNIPNEPITISDGAVRFLVDIREGQKTGFYLDQRANRRAVAGYLTNRTVLDCFCYTGGFALHAAKSGAASVEAVDVSHTALAMAAENARLNAASGIQFIKANVFEHLAGVAKQGRTFDAVILDPPKFARRRQSIVEALSGYRVLLRQATRILQSEGILVMCCCSGLIDAIQIEDLLAQVAEQSKRPIQILERRGQDVDHPVNVACPESSYLKCFICRVV